MNAFVTGDRFDHMRTTLLIIIAVVSVIVTSSTYAAELPADEIEYKLKAAYMLNFAKFMTWPSAVGPEPAATFPICVYGENPFGSALDGVRKKSIRGKNITIEQSGDPAVLKACRMVFVSRSETGKVGYLINQTKGTSVVLVSDIQGFASRGGTIEFVSIDNKLRFIINNTQARKNGIKIAASLLKLAVKVY